MTFNIVNDWGLELWLLQLGILVAYSPLVACVALYHCI